MVSAARTALAQALDGLATGAASRLRVDGTPVGAQVKLDGHVVGDLPWEGELAAGTHELVVSMQGYADEHRLLSPSTAPKSPLTLHLKPLPGTLPATAEPSAADSTPSVWNYIIAGGLLIPATIGIASFVATAASEGDCREHNAMQQCVEVAELGAQSWLLLGMGVASLAASAYFAIFAPIRLSAHVGPQSAYLQLNATF